MARAVIPEIPHHITQRGNRREDVFFSDRDNRHYLRLLKDYSDRNGLEILAYCLMANHVHLVAIPRKTCTLAAVLGPVHLRYAQYVNRAYNLGGRLWQGRFFSCPLDERHCGVAIRYVERNPVRAGLVRRAEDYQWSSAAGHIGTRADPLLTRDIRDWSGIDDWSDWLGESEGKEAADRLRMCTRTGRPLGDDAFIDRLEVICGRGLRPKKAGRPRKR